MVDEQKICVGLIAGAHGLRGLVRLHSFTEDPESIVRYTPLTNQSGGREFKISLKNVTKDAFIAEIEGVLTKEAADALRGTRLYVARAFLPKVKKHEYYEADLIGLRAEDEAGQNYGTVWGIHNHGAGPYIELGENRKNSFMLPFTDACVPEVDIKSGKLLVRVPDGWVDQKIDKVKLPKDKSKKKGTQI